MQLTQPQISKVEAELTSQFYDILSDFVKSKGLTTPDQLAQAKKYYTYSEMGSWWESGMADIAIKHTRQFDYNDTKNNAFWESVGSVSAYCRRTHERIWDALILNATINFDL